MLRYGKVHALDSVGSGHTWYSVFLRNFSVDSEYLGVVSEASSCIIHFWCVTLGKGDVPSNPADYLTSLNETLLLHCKK